MHVGPWLERLADHDGEPRDRLVAALDDARAGCRDGVHAARRRGGAPRGRDPRPTDGGARERAGGRAIAPTFETARPARAAADRAIRARGRTDHGEAFALAARRVHGGPPQRSGSDVVSEAGTHAAIARARTGGSVAPRAPSPTVRAALAEVPDPELPVLSVVDLGIVHRGRGRRRRDRRRDPADVRRLPGARCHPQRRSPTVSRRFGAGPRRARHSRCHGRRTGSRRRVGARSPRSASPRRRPVGRCAARSARRRDVVMDSAFGPTQCRSLFYCRACRQPFEALKSVSTEIVGHRRRRRRWVRASPRSRSRPAARSCSMTSIRTPSSGRRRAIRDGLARRAARLDLDADSIDDWVDGRLVEPASCPPPRRARDRGGAGHRGGARGPRAEADDLPGARRRGRTPT